MDIKSFSYQEYTNNIITIIIVKPGCEKDCTRIYVIPIYNLFYIKNCCISIIENSHTSREILS